MFDNFWNRISASLIIFGFTYTLKPLAIDAPDEYDPSFLVNNIEPRSNDTLRLTEYCLFPLLVSSFPRTTWRKYRRLKIIADMPTISRDIILILVDWLIGSYSNSFSRRIKEY